MSNKPAVNAILSRITQLKEQRSQLRENTLAAEIVKDAATDRIDRAIKEGRTQEASGVSTQLQQPAQLEINKNIQQLVTVNRDIAQLSAQVAKLTGQLPADLSKELGNQSAADLQNLLARDPIAFERATVEIYSAAAAKEAEFLRQQGTKIDYGDEVVQLVPPLPSDITVQITRQGVEAVQDLQQDAQTQYQQFIQDAATQAIPRYANGASPPPVAVSTAVPGTTGGTALTRVQNPTPAPQPQPTRPLTGGASLTRVQNPTPAPQTVPGGRDIAIATGAALAGTAALAFINRRGNVVPIDTPGLPPLAGSVATPPIVPQQPVSAADPQSNDFVFDPATGEQVPADSAQGQDILAAQSRVTSVQPEPVGGFYQAEFDPATGLYNVVNEETGEVVASGLSQQEATITAQDFSIEDPQAPPPDLPPSGLIREPTDADVTEAARIEAARQNARNQQSIREQRGNNVNSADWRVRLRLAPNARYLYQDTEYGPGILDPLAKSDGVIFPYTPTVQTVYKADYTPYNLTHSNYRGFFYQSSYVEDVNITGTFTAQDSVEAAYLLAVIHFFRSATKMFYGQGPLRGAPPPLVYLSAFGAYQYVDAPCVISQFNYNLPADVDYIRARSPNQDGTNLLKRRDRQNLPTNAFTAALQRLKNARPGGLPLGGEVKKPAPPTLGLQSPTYVPTKMDITIVLHPMQSRRQVSQQFSVQEYAPGRLTPRGFW